MYCRMDCFHIIHAWRVCEGKMWFDVKLIPYTDYMYSSSLWSLYQSQTIRMWYFNITLQLVFISISLFTFLSFLVKALWIPMSSLYVNNCCRVEVFYVICDIVVSNNTIVRRWDTIRCIMDADRESFFFIITSKSVIQGSPSSVFSLNKEHKYTVLGE